MVAPTKATPKVTLAVTKRLGRRGVYEANTELGDDVVIGTLGGANQALGDDNQLQGGSERKASGRDGRHRPSGSSDLDDGGYGSGDDVGSLDDDLDNTRVDKGLDDVVVGVGDARRDTSNANKVGMLCFDPHDKLEVASVGGDELGNKRELGKAGKGGGRLSDPNNALGDTSGMSGPMSYGPGELVAQVRW
ncbi:unnamed protein product [Ilex paraguariensis]|uniref:Uncharacterized protein n=1 Tax=Ilex paraguariensis TaxID=185542 RepID=A0ABC8T174_9AQUA